MNIRNNKNISVGMRSQPSSGIRNNPSYNDNAGYVEEDSLYDNSRGRNMKIQRQKKTKSDDIDW